MAAIAFQRKVWEDKIALLMAGAEVYPLSYGRASKDKKKERYSVSTQLRMNREKITRSGWAAGEEFSDNDAPASRHTPAGRRKRKDFNRLVATIRSGVGDVLVMTDMSRSQRMLGVYAMLRDLCFDNGLFFWMVEGSLFDLRMTADRASLGQQALNAETQVDQIHDNTSRGLQGQIDEGRPHSHTPYGYQRFKNRKTGAFEKQVFDDGALTAIHDDGTEEIYTPYSVIRGIFWSLRRMLLPPQIAEDLNRRGIPSPGGKKWSRQTVESIATNAVYIGKRVHLKRIVGEGQWKGIVEPKVFWNVNALLHAYKESGRTHRPFTRKWLQSYSSRCGECGGWLTSHHKGKKSGRPMDYICVDNGCASVDLAKFDSFVEAHLVSWLSRKDVFEKMVALTKTGEVDVSRFETMIAEARQQIREIPAEVKAGRLSLSLAGAIESQLEAKITEAQEAIRGVAIPEVLLDLVGPDAAEQWEAIDDIELRREIVRMVCAPRLHSANKNRRIPLDERVSFGGLMGELAA